MTEPPLDTDHLTRLRLAAGLSKRKLALHLGVTSGVIDRLEEGRSQDDLPLRRVILLADALAVPPGALFRATGETPAEPDDVLVEAALAASPTFVRTDELARGFGWELNRTHAALRRLRRRLGPSGQDLRRTTNGWALVSRADLLSRQQQAQLERARFRRRGLNIDTARLLHELLAHDTPADFEQHLTNTERVALGSLLKAQLAERTTDGFRAAAGITASLQRPQAETHDAYSS